MSGNIILRVATKLLAPYILLFALYVQFHGDLGPGGGFQAGVIFGAGFILYALVYGLENTRRVLPPRIAQFCSATGFLLYAATGVIGLLRGANFLNYNVLAHDPHHGQHWGIFSVEMGVFITVFGTMVSIFYAVAGRKELD
ncbi:MAG: Na(+)/H(+) antiporter subunit B [Gemmatimonadetes bacterium]|nr:Na(+)/H(+) antiporter subunit B [Gemmatimonadota bacterium]